MMLVHNIVDTYLRTWKVVDHRTDGLIFMSSIKPVLVIITCYWIVSYCGVKWMENRPPLACKAPIILYCALVVFLNAYILFQTALGGYRLKYKWTCDAITYDTSDEDLRIAKAVHLYMILKITELLDSMVVLALKVKYQPNFFVLFHHSTMVIIGWVLARYFAGGSTIIYGFFNMSAHIVTYIYVGFYAMGSTYKKLLVVRCLRLLNSAVQSMHYIAIVIFSLNGVLTACNYPHFVYYMFIGYIPALGLITAIVYPVRKQERVIKKL